MLGFLFGFNARLGRLHFFLVTIALAIVMTVICLAIVMVVIGTTSPSMIRPEYLVTNWAIIAAMVFFGLAIFTLQSMRIRDIGWDPVCVIPGWIALMVVDHLVAARFPAWAIGQELQGTIVGGLVNLGLLLVLTFWPSADSDGATQNPFQSRAAASKPSPSSERLTRISQGARPTWS